MKYGEIFKKLRTEKGLSQKELTDRLTINRSTYARYETSSTQPDFETLSKLADFYDVSIDYLLGRTDNKNALHTQAGISDEAYNNLSAYQKEVIDFFLTRENLFFKNQPENLLDALEQFEVYYEVWKKQQENKK
ncbi:helix-turn-helix transcriptional regulator [Lysinibacillus mangiferihumi]|uniref:Helix-turn-helix transcriptional regulator n=1 Tax=Lysinibacillus mangiferihumi TaxID=1130819 RepID=A0A4U2YZR3_9BACI|nr:helix-turn-helix domain-containing protein [Lysinibacillus mangiferihumi]TKI66670.1 helix-turn-helix transcriptional regulator [Lysinibacillus mangiferihumi]